MADPQLRIWEGDSEQHIDEVNRWMRAQPWWQEIVAQHSGNAEPEELRQAIMRAAQAHGVVIDEGHIEVDPAGNFNPIGHKMRNFLIGAGIAGAGLGGAAALGAFGGGAGAAGGAGVGIGETAATTGLAGPIAGLPLYGAGGATLGGAAPALAGGLGSAAGGAAKAIGGGLGGWGGLVEGGLRAAGGIAQGRAQERLAEADLAARADATRLGAANFNRQTPGLRASNAVRGDVLAGVQPYALSGEGRNISGSGGLSPALLSDNTRNLGREMNRQAFLSQMGQGGATDPYANFVPTNTSKANGLDTALGLAGVVGSALPLVGGLPFLKPKTPPPTPTDSYEDLLF